MKINKLGEYEKNIPKSYAINFLRMMMFAVPIITIFFIANGLNMTQILLLQAYYSILLVFLEVPTGAIADTIGRKHSIIIGSLILTTAPIVYGFGHNFYDFMIAETLWAIGSSLISGADIALLYDTMKKLKRENRVKYVLSNYLFYMIAGGVASSLAYGFIVLNDPTYRWTFYLTAVPFFLATILSFSLKEPELYEKEKFSVKKYSLHIFNSIKYVKKNKHLLLLFLNFAFLSMSGRIGFWFFQPYMKASGIEVVFFGLAFTLFNVFAALSAKMATQIDKIFGARNSVILFSILQGTSFLGMAVFLHPAIAIFLLVFQQSVWGASAPLFLTYIHKYVKSKERATLDSFGSMLGNIIFSFFSPLFGFISDAFSMQTAFLLLGIIIIIQMILFKVEKI